MKVYIVKHHFVHKGVIRTTSQICEIFDSREKAIEYLTSKGYTRDAEWEDGYAVTDGYGVLWEFSHIEEWEVK